MAGRGREDVQDKICGQGQSKAASERASHDRSRPGGQAGWGYGGQPPVSGLIKRLLLLLEAPPSLMTGAGSAHTGRQEVRPSIQSSSQLGLYPVEGYQAAKDYGSLSCCSPSITLE